MIAIQLADRRYYPVLDDRSENRKRVTLTTANDNQDSVHIRFYSDESPDFSNPGYLGSISLSQLTPGSRSEQEVELLLELDDEGQMRVSTRDLRGGAEHQVLINTLLPQGRGSVENIFSGQEPDFDDDFIGDREDLEALNREAERNNGVIPSAGSFEISDPFDDDEESFNEDSFTAPKRRLNPLGIAGLALLATSALLGISYLIWRLLQGEPVPPLESLVPVEKMRALLDHAYRA